MKMKIFGNLKGTIEDVLLTKPLTHWYSNNFAITFQRRHFPCHTAYSYHCCLFMFRLSDTRTAWARPSACHRNTNDSYSKTTTAPDGRSGHICRNQSKGCTRSSTPGNNYDECDDLLHWVISEKGPLFWVAADQVLWFYGARVVSFVGVAYVAFRKRRNKKRRKN